MMKNFTVTVASGDTMKQVYVRAESVEIYRARGEFTSVDFINADRAHYFNAKFVISVIEGQS